MAAVACAGESGNVARVIARRGSSGHTHGEAAMCNQASTIRNLVAALPTLCLVAGCGVDPPPSRLFVADEGHAAIATLIDSNPSAGTLAIDRIISGDLTGLTFNLHRISLDAVHDRVYAAAGGEVLAFNKAGTANGNVPPRHVSGIANDSVFVDAGHDRLYVTSPMEGIKVIDNASTASDALPTRAITGDFGSAPILSDAVVDVGRDILYVLVDSSTFSPSYAVAVFDRASGLAGSVPRSRAIVLNTQITNGSLYLDDANDRLYVSGVQGSIMIFESAHTRDGFVTPDRFISLPLTGDTKITVDTVNDRLYAVSDSLGYVVNNISAATGAIPGVLLIAPPGSNLVGVAVRP